MLRIPAPTAKDRELQWSDAYDTAEALFAKAFKDCPQLMCDLTEVSLELVITTITKMHGIPELIAAAATVTAIDDLHEQYHNQI